ncbi:hypothetical protein DFH08DRAFT_944228 [Mycena albidolilacea]|uniref:Uncharacterized protein n=1 Tax=Mycena albidolilacea TaxID=1033008 RepID=A0AAD7EBZ9_9AGAR|nr:hypothetical protein DFH08DRAFT_944228 [Mycena albidolilacea]
MAAQPRHIHEDIPCVGMIPTDIRKYIFRYGRLEQWDWLWSFIAFLSNIVGRHCEMPGLVPVLPRLVNPSPISIQAIVEMYRSLPVQKPAQPAQTKQDPIISFEYKTLKLLKRMPTDVCMGHFICCMKTANHNLAPTRKNPGPQSTRVGQRSIQYLKPPAEVWRIPPAPCVDQNRSEEWMPQMLGGRDTAAQAPQGRKLD